MKKVSTFGTALGLLSLGVSAFAQFTSGNLVVSVVKSNNGSATTNAANRRILREYTVLGSPTTDVSVYGLATEVTGNNRRLTNSGTSTSEGFISISVDGKYIVLAGYDADIGTASIATAAGPPAIARVIGRYEWSKAPSATTLDTSTFLTDAYLTSNIRSVTSVDGSGFWTAGTSGTFASAGVRYVPYSAAPAGTSTQLASAPTNTRVVRIYGGQLYVSTGSIPYVGVNTVGVGTPTTSGQTIAQFPGMSTLVGSGATQNASPYDFVFDGDSTLYIADDFVSGPAGTAPDPGLQKWVKDDQGTWIKAVTYTIPAAANPANKAGLRGLARASSTIYYAVTSDKRLVRLDVIGNNPTDVVVSVLATAPVDEEWRDVKILPTLNNAASGTITFQAAMSNVPRNQPLTIILTPTGGTPITQTVTPDANGNFSTQPVPPGNYRLRVKTAGSLSEATNVDLSSRNVSGLTFTLRGGDINDDNAVDIGDLSILIGVYNKRTGDTGFLPAADINNDGANDIGDLSIIIGNYNQLGNN